MLFSSVSNGLRLTRRQYCGSSVLCIGLESNNASSILHDAIPASICSKFRFQFCRSIVFIATLNNLFDGPGSQERRTPVDSLSSPNGCRTQTLASAGHTARWRISMLDMEPCSKRYRQRLHGTIMSNLPLECTNAEATKEAENDQQAMGVAELRYGLYIGQSLLVRYYLGQGYRKS